MTDTADLEMCYICQNSVKTSKNHCFALFTCVTQSSNTKLVEKVSELAQGAILVSDTDIVCRKCFILLNTIDKLQSGLEKLKHEIRVLIESRITNYEIGVNHVEIDQAEATLVEMDQNGLSIMSHVDLEDGNQMVESSQPLNDAIKEIVAEIDLERPETSLQILETQEDDLVTEKEEATPRNRKRKRSDDYQEEQNDGDDGPYEEQQEYIIQDDSYGDQDQVDDVGEYIPDVEDDITQDMPEEDANNIIDDVNDKMTVKPRVYMCDKCGQEYTNVSAFRSHVRREKGLSYKCKYCTQTFSSFPQKKRHQREHTGEVGDICEICGKVYVDIRSLRNHIRNHNGNEKFKCTFCNRGFHSKMHVGDHIASAHTGQIRYNCQICNRGFKTQKSMWTHNHIHHPKNKEPQYPCDQCPKKYYTSSHLKAHKVSHTDNWFPCEVCKKKFARKDAWKKHTLIHATRHEYRCPFCPQTFVHERGLMYHLKKCHCLVEEQEVTVEHICETTEATPIFLLEENVVRFEEVFVPQNEINNTEFLLKMKKV